MNRQIRTQTAAILIRAYNHEEKRKVQRGGLCNKCLAKGNIAKDCPKVNFKCQHSGCGGGHHTLMHRNSVRTERGTSNESNARDTRKGNQLECWIERCEPPKAVTTKWSSCWISYGAGIGNGVAVAVTGVGETRVCLGIIPVKVRGKGSGKVIETYALLTMALK